MNATKLSLRTQSQLTLIHMKYLITISFYEEIK